MGVQQKKVSRARRDKRRSHHALPMPTLIECSRCGQPVKPHRVCGHCGNYRGRQIVDMEAED